MLCTTLYSVWLWVWNLQPFTKQERKKDGMQFTEVFGQQLLMPPCPPPPNIPNNNKNNPKILWWLVPEVETNTWYRALHAPLPTGTSGNQWESTKGGKFPTFIAFQSLVHQYCFAATVNKLHNSKRDHCSANTTRTANVDCIIAKKFHTHTHTNTHTYTHTPVYNTTLPCNHLSDTD